MEVARHKAKDAAQVLQLPVLTMDVGLVCSHLNGLPGPDLKNWNNLLPKHVLALFDQRHFTERVDRSAYFFDVLAYSNPDLENPWLYSSKTHGCIAKAASKNPGLTFDRLFVPDRPYGGGPGDLPLADMPEHERRTTFGKRHLDAFAHEFIGPARMYDLMVRSGDYSSITQARYCDMMNGRHIPHHFGDKSDDWCYI